jgi:SRP-independent targeting protein 2/TMEM208
MAQKARKDRAKANTSTLNNLHIGTLAINILFLSSNFLWRRRSLTAYTLLSIPAIVCEFILERTGRPSYVNGALKSAGEDLAAQGLTEYMFDIVWITWGCLVAVILFGNWAWMLWAVVPAYGAVKGYSLLGLARGMMGGAQGQGLQGVEESVPAGNRKQRRVAA